MQHLGKQAESYYLVCAVQCNRQASAMNVLENSKANTDDVSSAMAAGGEIVCDHGVRLFVWRCYTAQPPCTLHIQYTLWQRA